MDTSNTHLSREPHVADTKKPDPVADKPAGRTLAPAGQSGDPAVQRLLAQRDAHLINMQPDDPEVARRRNAAKTAIEDIDRQLADLGFAAS